MALLVYLRRLRWQFRFVLFWNRSTQWSLLLRSGWAIGHFELSSRSFPLKGRRPLTVFQWRDIPCNAIPWICDARYPMSRKTQSWVYLGHLKLPSLNAFQSLILKTSFPLVEFINFYAFLGAWVYACVEKGREVRHGGHGGEKEKERKSGYKKKIGWMNVRIEKRNIGVKYTTPACITPCSKWN